ncbi:hypothetical protein G7046_g1133 [Stylonectria norvegica]|nr:hypothetical protein G7046_g1133 [Stylonectria norvegica]
MTEAAGTGSSAPEQQGKRRRSERHSTRQQQTVHPIDTANKTSIESFVTEYIKPSTEGWPQWTHPRTAAEYNLSLSRPASMTDGDLTACFELVDETSGADYRKASLGWHPAAKMKEMRSSDLWYVLVKDGGGIVKGFTSLMVTMENKEPVVYCYEIHLKPELQGTGLGGQLMRYLLDIGENIDRVEKVMLTCFVSNKTARAFYDKLGFGEDESSPGTRKLRGVQVIPDYVIMSRRTADGRAVLADGRTRTKQMKGDSTDITELTQGSNCGNVNAANYGLSRISTGWGLISPRRLMGQQSELRSQSGLALALSESWDWVLWLSQRGVL